MKKFKVMLPAGIDVGELDAVIRKRAKKGKSVSVTVTNYDPDGSNEALVTIDAADEVTIKAWVEGYKVKPKTEREATRKEAVEVMESGLKKTLKNHEKWIAALEKRKAK